MRYIVVCLLPRHTGARAHTDYSASFLKTAYDDVVYKRLGDEFKVSTHCNGCANIHGYSTL